MPDVLRCRWYVRALDGSGSLFGLFAAVHGEPDVEADLLVASAGEWEVANHVTAAHNAAMTEIGREPGEE
jgi:hypothetical protein